MHRLRLGDSRTRAPDWGGSVYFGGIQFGTQFSTQPGYISYPQPTFEGSSVVPTAVDVYLNNMKIYEGKTSPGPFELNNLPVITGSGMLRVETKDLLGNSYTYEAPYYTSPQLLKAGLSDYTVEIGKIRRDFSIKSNVYRHPFGALNYAYGVTPYWTMAFYGQGTQDLQVMGIQPRFILERFGVLGLSVVSSRNGKQGRGRLGSVSFTSHHTGSFNYGLHYTQNSRLFSDLSTWPRFYRSRNRMRLFCGVSFGTYGHLTLSYTKYREYGSLGTASSRANRLLNGTYGVALLPGLTLNVNIGKDLSKRVHGKGNFFAFASLYYTFDHDKRFNTSVSKTQDNTYTGTLSFTKAIPKPNGWGYNLSTTQGARQTVRGMVQMKDPRGSLTFNGTQTGQQGDLSLNGMGSVVVTGEGAFLTRDTTRGMVVVKTGEFRDVKVYAQNHLRGETNSNGAFLISDVPHYTPIRVRIAQEDLPMNSSLTNNELCVICPKKSAVLASFHTKSLRSVRVRLVNPKGMDMPVGALVTVQGLPDALIVGYERVALCVGCGLSRAPQRNSGCRRRKLFVGCADS